MILLIINLILNIIIMSEKLPKLNQKKARSLSLYENQVATKKLKESLYNL